MADNTRKKIPHAEHLTFVDEAKARLLYPGPQAVEQDEYLRQRALERKREYDEEQKRVKK